MLKIGLTGGLATGKSFVLNLFKEEGFFTLKADEIAKKFYTENTEIKKELIERFGKNIYKDKNINRTKLEEILFTTREKRREFEKIFYSHFIPFQKKLFASLSSRHKALVYESALLFEAGTFKNFDILILTYCSKEAQIERAVKRGLKREKVEKILKFQTPYEKLLDKVNFSINTEKSMGFTKKQTKKIIDEIRKELI